MSIYYCTLQFNPFSVSQFPQSTFMYLRAIYIFPASVCLLCCSQIGRPGINSSQIRGCRNWVRGRAVSFLGIHKSDFRYSVAVLFTSVNAKFRVTFPWLLMWLKGRGDKKLQARQTETWTRLVTYCTLQETCRAHLTCSVTSGRDRRAISAHKLQDWQ